MIRLELSRVLFFVSGCRVSVLLCCFFCFVLGLSCVLVFFGGLTFFWYPLGVCMFCWSSLGCVVSCSSLWIVVFGLLLVCPFFWPLGLSIVCSSFEVVFVMLFRGVVFLVRPSVGAVFAGLLWGVSVSCSSLGIVCSCSSFGVVLFLISLGTVVFRSSFWGCLFLSLSLSFTCPSLVSFIVCAFVVYCL